MNTRKHSAARTRLAAMSLALVTGGFGQLAMAQTDAPAAARQPPAAVKPDYAPYPDQQFPNRVYWGVAHVHTGYSFDSGMFGVTTTPDDLFRVATGGEVILDNGTRFKQDRPLDWVSITDHAEYMGISDLLRVGDPALLANPQGKRWYEMSKESPQKGVEAAIEAVVSMQTGKPVFDASKITAGAWAHAVSACEKWNQPGVFTTLHGFEWTCAPGGNNLHRTVVFRDGGDRVGQVVPFSTFDSQDPADLWTYMDAYAKKTGGQVLAIPHNGNMSNGQMYDAETFDGKPMDRAYAEFRASHEPLFEATQIKGDGEAHPYLSPNDEFADFEKWWDMNFQKMEPADKSTLNANYVRSALKTGLELQAALGANPYKSGLIGGNDAHLGVVTTPEDNFFGEFANGLPSPERWKTPLVMKHNDPKQGPLVSVWGEQAAGLGGVWARENTREGIWDALKRKECYATTGDRPTVRLFAGWDFAKADLDRADYVANGYAHGVPMGGDLAAAPAGKQPVFLVYAMRDPDGPNLDRIQVIKGWLGKDGKAQERIFDVAVSGGRKIGRDGRCKTSVGNTVDVPNATYSNSIGAPTLSAFWKDPEFDAGQLAFYYVRVIQIPSPRWTAYDAKRYGVTMPDYVPMTVTDRAYTSPVWYTPGT
ncbi:MAG: DUF3604 domain-containing protein [Lentisphaerae bacterium]|nr:DUF3604 domain-containing protein [Lentisphaerota bacterium]